MRASDEQDLRDFFSRAIEADMGVRSWMGPMLDEAIAAATSDHAPRRVDEYGWPVEPMRCRQTSSGASAETRELPPRAMAAAARTRRVMATLRKLDPRHVPVLAAAYGSPPPGSALGLQRIGDAREVALALVRREVLVELHRMADVSVAKDDAAGAALRARARESIRRVASRAAHALTLARDAYTAAAGCPREERRRRFRASLGMGGV